MDAGGLAQMSFNNNTNTNNLPAPGNSFASRGKASHISRLSVNPPTIYEEQAETTPAPRTSRSHLLAGLRTARKDANNGSAPLSAPYSQSRFGENAYNPSREFVPQTAKASTFGGAGQFNSQQHQQQQQGHSQSYSRPDQILSPPTLNLQNNDVSGMDPQVYQNLMATNAFLAQRQQMLQQQLMSVQAAAQQFQGMNLGSNQQQQTMSPNLGGFYNQQLQNGMQPIVQAVPNNPEIYQVYNPMTGQTSFMPAQSFQQASMPQSPGMGGFHSTQDSESASNVRRNNASPPNGGASGPWNRRFSPPRQSPSPPQQNIAPLPEPSANAFRPGHRKSMSSANRLAAANSIDAAKTGLAALRSPGFPQTPLDGTFGLGLGRAGEHPVRQPRGPPAMEELVAAPTSKHEGSKNFAARQRRHALFNLVRAGNNRRAGRPGSAEGEVNSSSSSDNDSPTQLSSDAETDVTANTLSATSSIGSLKAAANGTLKVEGAPDTFARRLTGSSLHSEEDNTTGERKRTPMLVLTSAEKRRTPSSAIVN